MSACCSTTHNVSNSIADWNVPETKGMPHGSSLDYIQWFIASNIQRTAWEWSIRLFHACGCWHDSCAGVCFCLVEVLILTGPLLSAITLKVLNCLDNMDLWSNDHFLQLMSMMKTYSELGVYISIFQGSSVVKELTPLRKTHLCDSQSNKFFQWAGQSIPSQCDCRNVCIHYLLLNCLCMRPWVGSTVFLK